MGKRRVSRITGCQPGHALKGESLANGSVGGISPESVLRARCKSRAQLPRNQSRQRLPW